MVKSCAERVNPHGLWVPALAGLVREPAGLRVRGGRGIKFFVRVIEC